MFFLAILHKPDLNMKLRYVTTHSDKQYFPYSVATKVEDMQKYFFNKLKVSAGN